MKSTNTFTGGMNKDLAKTVQKPDTYTDARNFRLVTETGQSAGSLINVRGNALFFTIPSTQTVYKITAGTAGTAKLNINSSIGYETTVGTLTVSSDTTGEDIRNFIQADASLTREGVDYEVFFYSNYVILKSSTVDTAPISTSGSLVVSQLVGALSNLQPIGFGTIRDDLYLFTTNDTSATGGPGQIWKLTYDKVALNTSPSTSATLSLLYNQQLNFTTQHPIPTQGAVRGNYENTATQKLYWTDNFNRLRSINAADPQVFAIDPSDVDVLPSVQFDTFRLQEIKSGGACKVGIYQFFYRYKTTGGIETAWSDISYQIPITTFSEAIEFIDTYYGSTPGNGSTKSIVIQLDTVDTSFDRIEVGYLYRSKLDGAPSEIAIFAEEPVSSTGPVQFTFTNTESMTTIDLNDLVSTVGSFTHCKTIAVKDQRLLAANIRDQKFDLDWDARAYRWPAQGYWATLGLSTNRTYVKDSVSAQLLVDRTAAASSTSVWGVPLTHDSINPNQMPYEISTGAVAGPGDWLNPVYKFQSNGTTIGGSGPNVSYKIVGSDAGGSTTYKASLTHTFYGDDVATQISPTATTPRGNQLRNPAKRWQTVTLNGKVYNQASFFDNYISPYYKDLMRGYQREEIYRFGIKFKDKKGRDSFVKWIADVQMPSQFEKMDTVPAYSTTEFIISRVSGANQIFNVLGIEFTVDISTIKDQISSFSIVRVKRDSSQRSIIASGLVFFTDVFVGGTTEVYPNWRNTLLTGDGLGACAGTSTGGNYVTMQSPDSALFANFPGFSSGDRLRTSAIMSGISGTNTDFTFFKDYTCNRTVGGTDFRNSIAIDTAFGVDYDSEPTVSTGVQYLNRTLGDCGALSTSARSRSVGGRTLFVDLASALTVGGLSGSTSYKYYGYYYRPLAKQYGGNTFSQRSDNQYISCNHYKVVDSTTANTVTETVFGGDVFLSILDNQKFFKNWAHSDGTNAKESVTWWFPVESWVDVEWRDENSPGTVNRTGIPNNSGTGTDIGEAFGFFEAFSSVNNIKTVVPKPAVFAEDTAWDNRIWASEQKISGELADNWASFLPNNYNECDSIHGPINNLQILRDSVIFLQDKAVGEVPINQEVLIDTAATSSSTLQLGTGTVVGKPRYISTQVGCKHQWGNVVSDSSLYFFDILTKSLNILAPNQGIQSISDAKGLQGYFASNLLGSIQIKDNPIYNDALIGTNGISCTYDHQNNEAIFTFHDFSTGTQNRFTVAYNEQFGVFTSFYDYAPSLYINDTYMIATPNRANPSQGYIHEYGNYGSFYGTVYNSIIEVVSNQDARLTKAFDDIEWHSEAKAGSVNQRDTTFSRFRAYTDYQNTDYQTLTLGTNLTREERMWQMHVPRDRVLNNTTASPDIFSAANLTNAQLFKKRMRDKYLLANFEFDNTNNYTFILHLINFLFRISPR